MERFLTFSCSILFSGKYSSEAAPEVLYESVFLEISQNLHNFAKCTGKHLCQSLSESHLCKRNFSFIIYETLAQVFPVNFVKFLRTPFTEHLWTAAFNPCVRSQRFREQQKWVWFCKELCRRFIILLARYSFVKNVLESNFSGNFKDMWLKFRC